MKSNSQFGNNYNSVLVAVLNNPQDLEILKKKFWYRIPVDTAPEYYKSDFIAFYNSDHFKEDPCTVRYFAQILSIKVKTRAELIPDEPYHPRAKKKYYQVKVGPLLELPQKIPAKGMRKIVFLPSNLKRLVNAHTVSDLYIGSHIEEKLWAALKKANISAEREYLVEVDGNYFFLDFACFCENGKIDIECDGKEYHSDYESVKYDKDRGNLLTSSGWQILRFTSDSLNNNLDGCLMLIRETVKRYGGHRKE